MNKDKDYLNKFLEKPFKGKYKVEGWVAIPNKVVFDDRLSKSDLLVFWVLTIHQFRGKDFCFPSQKLIAEEAKLSRPTVNASVKRLEKYGYLEIEKKRGFSHRYYLKVYK